MMASFCIKPCIEVHLGYSFGLFDDGMEEDEMEEEEEEEDTNAKVEVEVREVGYTHESEAPKRKKTMCVTTPQSKHVPHLIIDGVRDMYSRDATATSMERRMLKGKKTLQRVRLGGDHHDK